MAIPLTNTFAEFYEIQLGHTEKYERTDEGYKIADPFTSEIREWIYTKIEENMPLRGGECCNIEDVGSKEVFARYIVDLPIGQEVFIHFYISAHGLSTTFLIWGKDDPERDGDPVQTWEFSSSDDDVVFGMIRMHLRNMLGSRSHDEIMNLYK